MKVAVIGKQNQLHWLSHVVSAYKRDSDDVLEVAYNNLGILTDSIRGIKKLINKSDAEAFNVSIVERQLTLFKPDLILVISPLFLPISLSQLIGNKFSCLRVAWIGDVPNLSAAQYLECFDHVFATDTGFLPIIKSLSQDISCSYLPLAADEELFVNKYERRSDSIIFIGSSTDNRNKFICELPESLKLILVGNRWKTRLSKSCLNSFEIINKNIKLSQLITYYNQYNFILNMKSSENVLSGINMRTFETMAMGCCLLNDDVEDLNLHFENGKHLLVYQNADDLYRLWELMLYDRNKMVLIQNNAASQVRNNHTYKHRIASMKVYLDC